MISFVPLGLTSWQEAAKLSFWAGSGIFWLQSPSQCVDVEMHLWGAVEVRQMYV